MAQFRAIIQGSRGEASRLGTKRSGIDASVDGWDVGVNVRAWHENGTDRIIITATGGSNNGRTHRCIAVVHENGEIMLSNDIMKGVE